MLTEKCSCAVRFIYYRYYRVCASCGTESPYALGDQPLKWMHYCDHCGRIQVSYRVNAGNVLVCGENVYVCKKCGMQYCHGCKGYCGHMCIR